MRRQLRLVLSDPETAQALAARGLETIRARHTCAHRVDELMEIVAGLANGTPSPFRAEPVDALPSSAGNEGSPPTGSGRMGGGRTAEQGTIL